MHNTAGKPPGYVRPFNWDDESVTGVRTQRSKQNSETKPPHVKSKREELFEKIGWTRPQGDDDDVVRKTPERQYNQILDNKSLSADFFKDSEHDHDSMAALSDTSSENPSEQSFELDETHCLNLFNILKHEPSENMSPFK